MDPNNTKMLQEILRLTRETNDMIHRQRRNAFLLGFLKFIVYAVLFAAPIWFYMTYISSDVDSLLNALNRAQGVSSSAQTKFVSFENTMQTLEEQFKSALHLSSTTATSTQP